MHSFQHDVVFRRNVTIQGILYAQAQQIASGLAGLSDVEITNVQDKDVLAYDVASQKWKNTDTVRMADIWDGYHLQFDAHYKCFLLQEAV